MVNASFPGRPALVSPYIGFHRTMILINFFLLLQKFPACLTPLPWMVCEMRNLWLCSRSFIWCCFQVLLKTAVSIFMHVPSWFSSKLCVRIQEVQPNSPSYNLVTTTVYIYKFWITKYWGIFQAVIVNKLNELISGYLFSFLSEYLFIQSNT